MATDLNDAGGAPAQGFPLRLGGAGEFARAESLLRGAGFDEATVCRVLKIDDMADLSSVKPAEIDLAAAGSETLGLLIKIFLLSQSIYREEVERVLDPAALGSLLSLDVLRAGSFDAGGKEAYYSTVFLYPVAGLLIASDRHNNPDGSPFTPPPDIVFPGINAGSLLFLRVISRRPAAAALDLCTGSGIAALVLGECAERVTASDITERARHFVRFNRLLNRRHNVEVELGDLYSAVEGQSFDRIVAHPPYVPSLSKTVIYRDGGETGEALVRRIVEGLPTYLRPGGTLYCVCIGLDTNEGGFETRARGWLGEAESEFDVIFALSDERSPKRFAREVVELNSSADPSDVKRWDELFSGMGVRSLVYGVLVIHRRAERDAARPLTARPRLSAGTDGSCFDWAFDWHHSRSRSGADEALAGARPRLAPRLRVKVTHAVREGRLTPAEFLLESDKPFAAVTKVDPWIVSVIQEFDGERTTSEIYQAARDASALPPSLGLGEFIGMISTLVERGYVKAGGPAFDD